MEFQKIPQLKKDPVKILKEHPEDLIIKNKANLLPLIATFIQKFHFKLYRIQNIRIMTSIYP